MSLDLSGGELFLQALNDMSSDLLVLRVTQCDEDI
jgi:hypothetical protein